MSILFRNLQKDVLGRIEFYCHIWMAICIQINNVNMQTYIENNWDIIYRCICTVDQIK
jgi:hypothetical protein